MTSDPTRPAPLRVLVCDDNEDAAASLAGLLVLLGFHPRYFVDGSAALTAAASFRPDACLIDLRMPGVDGYEVARRLRAAHGPDLLLVAVTADHGPDVDRRTAEAGFDLRFAKPADPAELVRALSGRGRAQSVEVGKV